ncbi:inner membrane protein [Mucilaginibacter lappiensis]|uniref:Inner membrane protein n=1 Tax=Mucilaginibacter lappiensis TaxID=354630 RepID=A0ABR6PKB6_9SPHI|nr:cell envelope integrity protein CreD [Mucilaginibacter lappiensis]MBB6110213.1 inner membrane protein [Mucilaginibacter lappiensis]SIR26415.1 inner membrane protein [Mucilaginibacter lappiensis]
MTENESPKHGIMDGLKESITVKLLFIATLILLLLIPSSLVNNLIDERTSRQDEMMRDVSDKWSGSQVIKGPVLVIPYKQQVKDRDASNKEVTREIIENLYILPDNLHIKAGLTTQIRHRGIFDVAVYNSLIKVSGNFAKADLGSLSLTPDQLLLNKARIVFSISDLKGLKNNPVIKANDQTLTAEPLFESASVFGGGLQVAVDISGAKDGNVPFEYALDLKGSQNLSFLHLGKTTDVEASGTWSSPSFDGRYLPDDYTINKNGFKAHWRMLYYNRPFPQQWVNNDTLLSNDKKLGDAVFGIKLRLPVDQYQKTMRTSKYALLIIALTFISLFLTEVIRKQRIHIFNYILIGLAMIIYYSLLLSFSEQVGYNYAYLIASVSTIALVSVFIASLLKNKMATWLFAFILSVFYAFIFVIIQLEDFALIIGSVALFMVVAVLMYFSRRINWDRH